MPLSDPAPRQHLHTRKVTCAGFLREDGRWDIEGHITDEKTYGFDSDQRGHLTPGTPLHDMWIRLTVTEDFEIVAVEAVTDAGPFTTCPAITPNFQRLVGLKIRPGFTAKVKDLLGGVEGCTHLVELLGPIATTAFQSIYPWLMRQRNERRKQAEAQGEPLPPEPKRAPPLLNTCHAFAADGPVVRRYWPDYAVAPATGS